MAIWIREGFHGWDLMVVVGFSGTLFLLFDEVRNRRDVENAEIK